MGIVAICSLICLLLTYMESKGASKNGMLYGFLLVTLLGCIHFNYGNDYVSYYHLYNQIETISFDFKSIMNGDVYRERGWVLLCYAFKPFGGFFTLVAVLNVIQNYIIYNFIRKEVKKDWWPLSVFFYLFHSSYYLLNFSMMKQGFVICIFLGLWPLIRQKKWLISAGILFLCSFIHGSSLILIPFAFVGFLSNINGKYYVYFFVGIILFLWSSISFIEDAFNSIFLFKEFDEYTRYQDDSSSNAFGLGFLIQLLPLLISIYYFWSNIESDKSNKVMVAIATLTFIVTPFTTVVPAVGRIGLYFGIYNLAAWPITYSSINNKGLRIFFISLYVTIISYDYLIFFSNPVFAQYYAEFHTIFSVH